ncbi:MAG TPA: hypothetical protein VF763_03035 [Candidatus Limnocylindrales bacterium]
MTGPRRLARGVAGGLIGLVAATSLAACSGSLRPLPATPPPTPAPTATLAIRQVRGQLEADLRLAGIGLIDASQPFRPPEPPELTGAPRAVLQAVLPDDPEHGFVVVYDLGDPAAAATTGRAMAAYLAGGPTRVQFPSDTRFVLRQVGSTLVFYPWSTAGPDPTAGRVAQVLGGLGSSFPGAG